MEANVTFYRVNQFYGVIVPIKVFLDGKEVGSVSVGERISTTTTIGKHKVAFNLWSGNGQYEIEVTEEHPNIEVEIKLHFGMITSKPKIEKIKNL